MRWPCSRKSPPRHGGARASGVRKGADRSSHTGRRRLSKSAAALRCGTHKQEKRVDRHGNRCNLAAISIILFYCAHPVRFVMCRNIKTLYNFKPPATEEEIRASSLQFVRKLSGFTRPSKSNELAFDRAVKCVADAAHELLASLVTNATPRDREVEALKARARSASRFGSST